MNSALGRLLTTAGQMTDERKDLLTKALLLAGPAKVSDVDQDKARASAGRDAIKDVLDQNKGVSAFERLYVSPENMGMLSPEERRLYQLYQYLQRQARDAAAKKKEKK